MSKTKNLGKPEGYIFGRPTKYRPQYCQQIIDYFKNFEPFDEAPIEEEIDKDGQVKTKMKRIPKAPPSLTKFATSIDVSRGTLHEWSQNHKDFSDALESARKIYKDIYIDGAVLGLYNPYFTALIMKNRFDWVDKKDINHSGGVDVRHIYKLPEKNA
jgi:tRNA(Glu) U13 pseudouridine synthase TruD